MRALPAPGRSRGGCNFYADRRLAQPGSCAFREISPYRLIFVFLGYFKKKNKYHQQKESYNGNLSPNPANKCDLSFE
jgi:hypothetical protein